MPAERLDLFSGEGAATAEEINERATSEDHGWAPLEAREKTSAAERLVVSFDNESDRRAFHAKLGIEDDRANAIHADQFALFEVEVEEKPDELLDWLGLPEFVPIEPRLSRTLYFDTEEARTNLMERAEIATVHKGTRGTLSVWWPDREREDLSSLRFEVAK